MASKEHLQVTSGFSYDAHIPTHVCAHPHTKQTKPQTTGLVTEPQMDTPGRLAFSSIYTVPGQIPGGKRAAGLWLTWAVLIPQNITSELLQIEPEKTQRTAECEAFVQALPGSGTTPLLRTRMEDTNQKYERLVQLLDAAQKKWVAGGQEGGHGEVQGAT